ncbi:uncharacterized protein At4g15970-like [Corylus avellana]|uniref:uncharacterized protein At4g15970-like n=1 Tax=Corylus avellana TaxID=13451 RepID=UPI00286B2B6B|nr:uncharacterized protein At4g15970-like [Corylus avellana]
MMILLLIFLFLFQASKPNGMARKAWLLHVQPNAEATELVRVLRRTSMADKTVIVTILDETWASPGSVLDLFLESFRVGQGTQRFLNHLVVVALDNQAFQYCNAIHPHCFQLPLFESKIAAVEGLFTTPDHLMLNRRRNDILLQVIELGYNLVFTEADSMWFRSPFSDFHPIYQITVPCDFTPQSGRNKPDKGIFHMKSDDIAVDFLKYWQFERVLYPNTLDLSLCEMTTRLDIVDMVGVRIKYPDPGNFGGFCEDSKDMSEVYTMHAACCDNVKHKVHDMRLLLDDWINFTAKLSANASLGPSSFSWRAPKKCMR